MPPSLKPSFITAIIGAILALSGLFILGFKVGANMKYKGIQSPNFKIGLMLTIGGSIVILFSSYKYLKGKR